MDPQVPPHDPNTPPTAMDLVIFCVLAFLLLDNHSAPKD